MLAEVVLVLQLLRGGLNLRIDRLTAVGHFGDLLQHDRVVHRLKGILAPDEGAVVLAKAAGYGSWIFAEPCIMADTPMAPTVVSSTPNLALTSAFKLAKQVCSPVCTMSME